MVKTITKIVCNIHPTVKTVGYVDGTAPELVTKIWGQREQVYMGSTICYKGEFWRFVIWLLPI